ncbi:cuticle protein 64-like [Photinus pyralis]|uniref:cuticle protein 64-like n=1 Tax=Photinus pyralis TaxID=7054 RepID=UPI0012670F8F|nr:cuticle protein 64-like [Photinus pyralis]
MFKLVVLSIVIAVVAAAPTPGYLHAAPIAYIPSAVSHSSRIDYHSKPIVTYTAPLVTSHVVAAPIIKDYSLLGGYGYGYGHGFDLHGVHGW